MYNNIRIDRFCFYLNVQFFSPIISKIGYDCVVIRSTRFSKVRPPKLSLNTNKFTTLMHFTDE